MRRGTISLKTQKEGHEFTGGLHNSVRRELGMRERPQDKSEFLARAAEAHRFARESRDAAEKADLLSVERRWRSLGGTSDEEKMDS
jgi:hypothetical protein